MHKYYEYLKKDVKNIIIIQLVEEIYAVYIANS